MSTMQNLIARVQQADVERIKSPVLRHLVGEIQSKSSDLISREAQAWTDNTWSQWRQHTSHNPW